MPLHSESPAPLVDGYGAQKTDRLGSAITQEHKTPTTPRQVVLTAIPWDHDRWGMKAVGPEGAVRLPGIFFSRLEALGACVLLAEQCGARVCP